MGNVSDKKRRQSSDIDVMDFLPQGEKDSDGILLGVELEYHASGPDLSVGLIEIIQSMDNFIIKADGSLVMGGYEIVSAPLSLSHHKSSSDWPIIMGLADASPCMGRDKGAGLHIHVNRDSGIDFIKARALIYSNPKFFFDRFAHRSPKNTYGRPLSKVEGSLIEDLDPSDPFYTDGSDDDEADDYVSGDGVVYLHNGLYDDFDRYEIRYQAVNIRTKDYKTVEFRMFNSTKNLGRLYQALELCHSIAIYTREFPLSPYVSDFYKFIDRNAKTYPSVFYSFYRNGRLFYPHRPEVILSDIGKFIGKTP